MNNILDQIQKFTYLNLGEVRTVTIDGKVYLCAVDVSKCIGLNTDKAVYHFKESLDLDIQNYIPSSPEGLLINDYYAYFEIPIIVGNGAIKNTNMMFLTEPGLYFVIMRSNKPEAATFRHWVFTELLPRARELGSNKTIEVLNNELNQLRERNNMLLGQNQELGVKLMAKDSECVCTTAYVVYSTKLTPEMKREAMIFDPGEDFNYDKMREDMRHIEDGSNFYPTQLSPQINQESQEFLNNCGFKFVSFK